MFTWRFLFVSAMIVLATLGNAVETSEVSTSTQVFNTYSPFFATSELLNRLLSRLTAQVERRKLSSLGERFALQPVDLAAERFLVHVPQTSPPSGYGLLVFIPPSDRVELPTGWAGALDRLGIIFAAADRAGNDANAIARCASLALPATIDTQRRYETNLERVFVGGFSGGSRVGLRLALA